MEFIIGLIIVIVVFYFLLKYNEVENRKKKLAESIKLDQERINKVKEVKQSLISEEGFLEEDMLIYFSERFSTDQAPEYIFVSPSKKKFVHFKYEEELVFYEGNDVLDVTIDSKSDTKMSFSNDDLNYNRRIATSKKIPLDISVHIITKGKKPNISIVLYHNKMAFLGNPDTDTHTQYMNRANELKANLLALRTNENIDVKENQQQKNIEFLSTELEKISKLKNDGILTEEEYQRAKEKVLA